MAIQLSGSLAITGSLVATSQIIAQTLNVQQVTSSIVYSSGSNIFGNSLANTQIMTGSVSITGSLSVNGSPVVLTNQTASTTFVQGGNSFGTQALIGTNDNQNLALETNGTVRMFISSSGVIGVGTTSPVSGLDVRTSVSNTTGYFLANGSDFLIQNPAGSTIIGTSVTQPLRIFTDNTERVRITSGGNVGIGTTNPLSRLHINTGTNQNLRIRPGTDVSAANGVAINSRDDADATLQQLSLRASDVLMLVTGNVGIGTASPQFAGGGGLQINTSGTDTRLHLTNTTTGVTGTDGFELALVGNDVYYDSKESAGTHIFYTAGSERMRILQNGNIGIGTTDTQTFRLAVDGPNVSQGDTTTTIRVLDTTSATTGTGGGISFGGYFSGTSSFVNTFSYIKGGKENSTSGDYASYLSFGTRVNGGSATERLRITSVGTVQPGTNGTQDLGSSSLRWATVFTSDLDMSNGIGDYTIVEGEEDLFLYNNKTNKVFKFLIQEVDPSTAPPKKIRN